MTVVITLKVSDNAKNRRKSRRAFEREEKSDNDRQLRLEYYAKNCGCIKAAKAVSVLPKSLLKQPKANPEIPKTRTKKSNSSSSLTCRARQKLKLGEKPLIK